MLRVALPLAVTVAVAVALPAPAQSLPSAERIVAELLKDQLLSPSDKVWIALPSDDRSEREIAACDALSMALSARGIAVAWDVGMASAPAGGGFQEQLAALKGMGATKLLSLGRSDDLGNLTLRIADLPGGWLRSIRTVTLDRNVRDERLEGKASILPAERTATWSPRQGVGVQYSSLSGSGASYRRWSENGWGFQVAGIPALSFTDSRTTGFVNLGLQGMSPLLKTDRLRLYTLLGLGALYRPNEVRHTYDPETQLSTSYVGTAWDLGLAPGVGVDYRIHDRFLLTGALGYTFSRQSFGPATSSYGYSPGVTLGTLIEW